HGQAWSVKTQKFFPFTTDESKSIFFRKTSPSRNKMTRLIGVAVPNCWVASAFVLLTSFSALLQQQCLVAVWALRPSTRARSPFSSPSGRRAARGRGQPLLSPRHQQDRQAAGSAAAQRGESFSPEDVDLEAGGRGGTTAGNLAAHGNVVDHPPAVVERGGPPAGTPEQGAPTASRHAGVHEGADAVGLPAGQAELLAPAAEVVLVNDARRARDEGRAGAEGEGARRVPQRLAAIERELQRLERHQRDMEHMAGGNRMVRNGAAATAVLSAAWGAYLGGTAVGAGAAVSG
ncbi:unnamed protein product, partial [Amoebophrya sp. A120]